MKRKGRVKKILKLQRKSLQEILLQAYYLDSLKIIGTTVKNS